LTTVLDLVRVNVRRRRPAVLAERERQRPRGRVHVVRPMVDTVKDGQEPVAQQMSRDCQRRL
jgi:hypothetical protein